MVILYFIEYKVRRFLDFVFYKNRFCKLTCDGFAYIITYHFHDSYPLQARCATFLPSKICHLRLTWVKPQNVKNAGFENKYLLTFRLPISSIRAPTWPEKIPLKPVEISLRHINFSICFVKQWFFWPIFRKKRGENPLSMGSLLFASTKIIHFSAKCKSI